MKLPQFTAEASVHLPSDRYQLSTDELAIDGTSRVTPALVGRWRIWGTNCEVSCIEVCTRFCHPTGWDCCGWETRCAVNCTRPIFTFWPFG
jgi:hypothetical protein